VQGDEPLLLAADLDRGRPSAPRDTQQERPKSGGSDRPAHGKPPQPPSQGMERFRVEIGRTHGVEPGNLVGAITSEADLTGAQIGRIDIRDDYSTIDLPAGMRSELFEALNKVRVRGQRLRLSVADGDEGSGKAPNTRDTERDGTRPEKKFDEKKFGEKKFDEKKSGEKKSGGKKYDGKKYDGKKGALKGSKSGKHRKGGNDVAGDTVKPKRKKDRHRNRGKRP